MKTNFDIDFGRLNVDAGLEAYGVGQSTHPMAINDRLLAEFTGILSMVRVWVFRLGILKS